MRTEDDLLHLHPFDFTLLPLELLTPLQLSLAPFHPSYDALPAPYDHPTFLSLSVFQLFFRHRELRHPEALADLSFSLENPSSMTSSQLVLAQFHPRAAEVHGGLGALDRQIRVELTWRKRRERDMVAKLLYPGPPLSFRALTPPPPPVPDALLRQTSPPMKHIAKLEQLEHSSLGSPTTSPTPPPAPEPVAPVPRPAVLRNPPTHHHKFLTPSCDARPPRVWKNANDAYVPATFSSQIFTLNLINRYPVDSDFFPPHLMPNGLIVRRIRNAGDRREVYLLYESFNVRTEAHQFCASQQGISAEMAEEKPERWQWGDLLESVREQWEAQQLADEELAERNRVLQIKEAEDEQRRLVQQAEQERMRAEEEARQQVAAEVERIEAARRRQEQQKALEDAQRKVAEEAQRRVNAAEQSRLRAAETAAKDVQRLQQSATTSQQDVARSSTTTEDRLQSTSTRAPLGKAAKIKVLRLLDPLPSLPRGVVATCAGPYSSILVAFADPKLANGVFQSFPRSMWEPNIRQNEPGWLWNGSATPLPARASRSVAAQPTPTPTPPPPPPPAPSTSSIPQEEIYEHLLDDSDMEEEYEVEQQLQAPHNKQLSIESSSRSSSEPLHMSPVPPVSAATTVYGHHSPPLAAVSPPAIPTAPRGFVPRPAHRRLSSSSSSTVAPPPSLLARTSQPSIRGSASTALPSRPDLHARVSSNGSGSLQSRLGGGDDAGPAGAAKKPTKKRAAEDDRPELGKGRPPPSEFSHSSAAGGLGSKGKGQNGKTPTGQQQRKASGHVAVPKKGAGAIGSSNGKGGGAGQSSGRTVSSGGSLLGRLG